MKSRFLFTIVFGLAFGAAYAQDAPAPPATGQNPANGPAATQGPHSSLGQHGGRMGGPGMGGRGIAGTVTALAPDHYTIKTEAGEIYTIHFSANTRIVKQRVSRQAAGDERGSGGPPILLKPTDISIGDAVAAMGEVDAATKSVGAVTIVQIDPERARQMREMEANYGKTWLMGKITAIDGVKVTLMGSVDNVSHTFVADENTTFRKHREPITMADMQVGDPIRVEGAIKGANFVATLVAVMPQRNVMMPRQPSSPSAQ
jgi:hypothetical protein